MIHLRLDQERSEATVKLLQEIAQAGWKKLAESPLGLFARVLLGEEAEIADEMDSVHSAPEPKK